MADISKIKTPNGNEYVVKDGTVKYKDIEGTTSSTGNITLDLNPAIYMIIGIRVGSSNRGMAIPWSAGTSWYAHIWNNDGSVKANATVSLRVEYKPLSTIT